MARIELPDGDDTEHTRVWHHAPELYRAAGAFSKVMYDTSLSTREREIARMRVAEINACPV